MNNRERLHKAVETAITAGYQLDSEAFAVLCNLAPENDPLEVISAVLKKIEASNEKPAFIEKKLIETAISKKERENAKHSVSTQSLSGEETNKPITALQSDEGINTFHPYAKEVQAKLDIIEDPTGKLTTNGTIEDYYQYFRDRFKRMERLLRQRIDVKSAAPLVEALKAPPKTKLKVICMITEKREAKQQTFLTVEDLQASATVLISHKAPDDVRRKAQMLILDQVVCIAVVKTRTKLLVAEDIILPEIGQKSKKKAEEPVYAVLTSDLHVGSKKFNKEAFKRFLLWLNGKYGSDSARELAGQVKYVLVAGDIVDGIGVYPNQAKELQFRDVYKQYSIAAKLLEKIPDYIEIIITPGNHDAPRKALPQPAIPIEYLETLKGSSRVHTLGDPSTISIHGVEVLMYHGRSLDDIIANIAGLSHNRPENAMKILLQGRHLAPLYGGKTLLSPENRDFLVIERVPDIFHSGHVHVIGHCNHRGVLIVNSGAWQEQTEYMQKLGLVPTPGKVPIVNLQTFETSIMSFT
jgi:DNA polymerase II small subunit